MKTKSIKQINAQLERIESRYPFPMGNKAYRASHLPRAYQIWNTYFDNIAFAQWERDRYAQSWEERENEQFPISIYAKPRNHVYSI